MTGQSTIQAELLIVEKSTESSSPKKIFFRIEMITMISDQEIIRIRSSVSTKIIPSTYQSYEKIIEFQNCKKSTV